MRIAVPVGEREKSSPVYPHFARTPFFAVFENDNFVGYLDNPAKDVFRGAGLTVANFLKDNGIDAVIAISVGRNAFETLKYYGIRIYRAREELNAEENVRLLLNGELAEMESWGRGRRWIR